MQVLGDSRWVTRSQVPLTPAPTIRMLSALEVYLETGAGSPYLRNMLERIGVDRVRGPPRPRPGRLAVDAVDPGRARARPVARDRAGGDVRRARVRAGHRGLRGAERVRRLHGREAAVRRARRRRRGDCRELGRGRHRRRRRRPGGRRPADGGPRRHGVARARRHPGRPVPAPRARVRQGAPGGEQRDGGGRPSTAVAGWCRTTPARRGRSTWSPATPDIAGVTASSSAGYADIIGPVRPELAPWSALDGDRQTFWRPAPFADADGPVGRHRPRCRAHPAGGAAGGAAGAARPAAGRGMADRRRRRGGAGRGRPGHRGDRRRPRRRTRRPAADRGGGRRRRRTPRSVSPRSRSTAWTRAARWWCRPRRWPTGPTTSSARCPSRGPACPPCSARTATSPSSEPSEESTGIDRTFVVPRTGVWKASGLAVARSRPGTLELLRPQPGVQVTGSSWLGEDPTVSPRMAHDRDPTTSWIADPRDAGADPHASSSRSDA